MVAFVASTVLTAANLNTAFNQKTINTQTGTTYTLVLTDQGGVVTTSNASAVTVTIPPNSSVAFATGTIIDFVNLGAGTLTIAAGAGVTVNGTITALAQYGFTSIIKTGTNTWSYMPPGGFPASATATVATSQTTTSAAFTDLTTVGPAVTVTTGTKALVIVSSLAGADLVNRSASHAYAVSGATTVAATDTTAHQSHNNVGTPQNQDQDSFVSLLTGLTAGSNTFTSKYSVSGAGTGQFSNRKITVIDMGS
jgi:hypothetical protein